jgi:BlaI family transcriptional regulator, penicillinase repressor
VAQDSAVAKRQKPRLSPLEDAVLRVLWERSAATADDVRTALASSRPLEDSSVRTILRRLEKKGYVSHTLVGRAFVYSPQIDSRNVAADAIRGIIDRFCDGSVEDLLVGMVDDEIVTPEKLEELAHRISRTEAAENRKRKPKKG